jgi:prepilin-type N-terminal cleavage/methylation domain-containing protein
MRPRSGFTLVELLVVVAIIVVLLALLAPALDQAIYQAELTVCAAQQRTIGQAALSYALHHKRHYPYRPAVDNIDSNWQAISLYHRPGAWGPYDDRPTLRPYMDINRLLNDPLVQPVDLDKTYDGDASSEDVTADVVASIGMWFGYRYRDEKGMHRIGDRWTYFFNNPDPQLRTTRSFDLFVSDREVTGGSGNVLGQVGVQCSHPDDKGILYNVPVQDGRHPWGGPNLNLTISMWLNLVSAPQRGLVDLNYTNQDLAVHRYNGVERNDSRMVVVRTFVNKEGGPHQVPRN